MHAIVYVGQGAGIAFMGFFLCFMSPDGKLYAIMFGRYSKKAYLCSGKMNVRGLQSSSLLFIKTKNRHMINKSSVQEAVDAWLEGKDYFLVELSVSADDRIVVEIDHADGVWIEDCADLSRFIESRISREEEDYELEVGSAGLGQPFRVHRQYEIHVGKPVETQGKDGKKYRGTLLAVDDEGFELGVMQKVREEGKKRPVMKEVTMRFAFDDTAYTKYLIKI